jgi:hypothetical protein
MRGTNIPLLELATSNTALLVRSGCSNTDTDPVQEKLRQPHRQIEKNNRSNLCFHKKLVQWIVDHKIKITVYMVSRHIKNLYPKFS